MDSEISRDHVRRELRSIEAAHRNGMEPMREMVERLGDADADADRTDDAGWADRADRAASSGPPLLGPTPNGHDIITGGLSRAGYLRVGGVAVASAAVLAACSDNETPAPTGAPPPAPPTADPMDVLALKTASSLEELAVLVYGTAIPLITDPTYRSVATLFQNQHKEHAMLFESATSQAGSQPFTQPNPAIKAQLVDPALPNLKTDQDILNFALQLESAAAATYFATVGAMKDTKLSFAAMTVGGTEFRHVALLKYVLRRPIDPTADAFLNNQGAVPVGTGIS